MKRKRPLAGEPVQAETVVPEAIIEEARRAIEADRVRKPARCVVCGGECASSFPAAAAENLCWVCRRLKLSAWRDTDSQMSAQE